MLIETSRLGLLAGLIGDETTVGGLVKAKRLKDGAKQGGYILLGPEDLKLLMENLELIPVEWKEKVNGMTVRIYFHAKPYLDEGDEERVRFLWWSGKRWQVGSDVLDSQQNANTPSAIVRIK